MSEKVVVLGAAGFIGRVIMKELQTSKIEAVGFSRGECDFLKLDEVKQKISPQLKDSTLIYTAGKHRQYGSTLGFYVDNNMAVVNTLYATEKNLPKKIIFLSTLEVYGSIEKNRKVQESLRLSPANLYAAGKISQEYLIRTWAHNQGVTCVIIRLPGIYGVNDNQTSIVSKLFSTGFHGGRFNLYTDGHELRDYLSVEDLASCIVKIIQAKSVPEILNMGSGVSVSIKYIIEQIEQVLGKSIQIRYQRPSLSGYDIVIDNRKLKNILGSFQFSSVEQGIQSYFNSFR